MTSSNPIAVSVIWVLLFTVVNCTSRERYPNLMEEPELCWKHTGVRPSGLRICDPDKIIYEESDAQKLQEQISELKEDTKCPCTALACNMTRVSGRSGGYTVTIALVKTMGSNNYVLRTARSYAVYLRSPSRGYYDAMYNSCEEDILIFLAYDQKAVHILTGSATRTWLSNVEVGEIINASHDEFRNSIYSGLSNIISRIKEQLPKVAQA